MKGILSHPSIKTHHTLSLKVYHQLKNLIITRNIGISIFSNLGLFFSICDVDIDGERERERDILVRSKKTNLVIQGTPSLKQ